MEADVVLDVSGEVCPKPVLRARAALRRMRPGEVLMVIATDKASRTDIPACVRRTGNELLEVREEESRIVYLIRKR
ncbi:MAG: sulfurtransferase TusA family protein [Euryarchaeota archaeon]|nr:sulfurtransferase TusA family protein [Euryarchaeota archaeon]